MKICDSNKCTGCYACVSACAHKSISMKEDQYGELHPIINEKSCVNCGLCANVCPNNTEPLFQKPLKCFASWIADSEKRSKCASGGIGTFMSEYIVNKGGIVYGTSYDKEFNPLTMSACSLDGVEKFKGSKYVQSIVGDNTFASIKKNLISGMEVLYIGTPCQIAGLKNYLRKDYANLITVDLICHGVSPSKWFKEELDFLINKNEIHNLSDVRFRGNDEYNYCLTLWQSNGESCMPECVYSVPRYEQPYFAGFMLGVSLRENCYSCKYARPDRVGDITIGDFLKLGKTIPFPYQTKHTSVVLINNEKARLFYDNLCGNLCDEINNVEREYSERLVYEPSLVTPFPKHHLHDEFRNKIIRKGFVKAIRSTLWKEILIYKLHVRINIFKERIKNLLPRRLHG